MAVDTEGSPAVRSSSSSPGKGSQTSQEEEGPWERLFRTGALLKCLQAVEERRCRLVCRRWRQLSLEVGENPWSDSGMPGGIAKPIMEELWHVDIGPSRRGAAWRSLLLGGITLQQRSGTHQDNYERLCETPSPYDSTIKRDVHRTLPQEELFREKNGKGQTSLFRILRALAIRLCDIGYCQSLNFVVATLIGVFPDDEPAVFECSLALLLRHCLVDLYRPKFPKLGVVVWQFDRIVEGFLPKVHAALVKHGVNSEYYAIQWFLTLFASDLPQGTVRRVWDRFLVAGWRVIVQVGLALLYTIEGTLPAMETCQALSFLRKFGRITHMDADTLLRSASTFKVSHRMLSALEAAYEWEDDVKLMIIKDLNSGQVHWVVQAVPPLPPCSEPHPDSDPNEDSPMPLPRAFARGGQRTTSFAAEAGVEGDTAPDRPQGTVLPFLLHNLDTGETTVMEKAWTQYTSEKHCQAKAKASPALASAQQVPGLLQSIDSESLAERSDPNGGSFWLQNVQRTAVRRLGQA